MKLNVIKVANQRPNGKRGYIARVVSLGVQEFDKLVEDACTNTTFSKHEARAAIEIFVEEVAWQLKRGFVVDLGPIGKIYPSCTSKWSEEPEQLRLGDVKPSLYYRPSAELTGAIKHAGLQWAPSVSRRAEENDEE